MRYGIRSQENLLMTVESDLLEQITGFWGCYGVAAGVFFEPVGQIIRNCFRVVDPTFWQEDI